MMTGRSWETAEATILEVRAAPANAWYGSVLLASIRPLDGGTPFETTFPCPAATASFQPPSVADLHDQGTLTDAEFATEKARILAEE